MIQENMKNLEKVNGQIFIEAYFDKSFAWYCKHAGMTDSVKIEKIKESSGRVVHEFTITIDGQIYFDINGLQARYKGTLEPYLNKLFLEQLTAFKMAKNDHILVEVSPILRDRHNRAVVYIIFHVQPYESIRETHAFTLNSIRVH